MEFVFELVLEGTMALFKVCADIFIPEKQKFGKKAEKGAKNVFSSKKARS